jgi:NADH-quinone oxidoreductase subunit M
VAGAADHVSDADCFSVDHLGDYDKVREFIICALVLETGMLGAFLALDMFVFYVMWEVMLIPMYFIIGIWGGEQRSCTRRSSSCIYTMVGSLLMLVAILYVVHQGTSR